MTTAYVYNLLRIASSLEKSDPILAYELERNALAVINPGAKKFEDHVKEVVDVLKGLKEDLEKADKQLDLDDAKEFAKFFDHEAEAEVENLRQQLKVGAVMLRLADESTSGIMDKVKGLFKKKDKKKEPETEEKPAGYQMSEKEQDEFVEGDRSWEDSGQRVEKESKENKEFFEDAKAVQTLLDKVRDKPSRSMVRTIIQDLGELIDRGMKLVKGDRGEGGAKIPKADNLIKSNAEDAQDLVAKYMPMLEGAGGADLMKVLKDFFAEVNPLLSEAKSPVASRKAILPLLVRTASANPGVRPILLPVIKRWTGKAVHGS